MIPLSGYEMKIKKAVGGQIDVLWPLCSIIRQMIDLRLHSGIIRQINFLRRSAASSDRSLLGIFARILFSFLHYSPLCYPMHIILLLIIHLYFHSYV